MKPVLITLSFLTAMTQSASPVKSLSIQSLDELLDAGKTVFVKFFSPSCPHCKTIAPVWEKAASKVQDAVIGEVDCSVNRDLCQRFSITGVPSLLLMSDNKVYKYGGSRELEAIVEFVTEGFKSVASTVLPDKIKPKTFTEEIFEAASEVLNQITVMFKYSPLGVGLLIFMGMLIGATSTGLVVLTATGRGGPKPQQHVHTESCGHKKISPEEIAMKKAEKEAAEKVD
jgi:thiol-disulfide isomerase/thioredoxin